MRKSIYIFATVVVLWVVLPIVAFRSIDKTFTPEPIQPTKCTLPTSVQIAHIDPEPVCLDVAFSSGVKRMELEKYLLGVLLAEMPAEFDMEALKAQAVVARTYTCKRIDLNSKHMDAAVCTDPACCQAYREPSAFGNQDVVAKVALALKQTKNQVLYYRGVLIEATYFSCSGGRTESALAVWGSDIPYLQAVDSPGEEMAAHFSDTVTFAPEDFASLLGISPAGQPATWFGPVTYTDGGGVQTIQIAGKLYDGVTVRKKLNLRSTSFTIEVHGQTISVTTKGFGHRVGMSQYGAQAMAQQGSTYRQILAYYYPGTTLETVDHN